MNNKASGLSDPEFLNRIWYSGFCNEKEIDRILRPKTAWDYLLKRRADIIADHPRFTRVFLNLSRTKDYTGLDSYFTDNHYKEYINFLSKRDQEKCKQVAYGDVFENDFNGYATFNNDIGIIIYLIESLRYFNNFINLAILEHIEDVPENIRLNALRIAVRIALQNESMDFLLDPRGIVPQTIFQRIKDTTNKELLYVTGHEFAHFLCGHLDNNNLENRLLFSLDSQKYYDRVYNVSQQQEFEADLFSIKNAKYNKYDLQYMLRAALIWFSALELVEYVQDIISPSISWTNSSHPKAKERYNNILNSFKISKAIKAELSIIRKRIDFYKKFLQEDISVNYDSYEIYGSAYLDEPNTEWRGRELIDRVDY